jgi:uncharacterized peroxidase-related enzyme
MSHIPPVDKSTAPAPVSSLLEGVNRGLGMTPNMFRVAGQSPAVLDALVGFFGAVSKGRLSAAAREAIALAVSEANGCDYCLSAHSALGERAGLDDQARARARRGQSDDRRLASLLALALGTLDARTRSGRVLEDARRAGLSDAEILEVVANVALTVFTNYLNQVAGTEIDFPVVHPLAA